MNGKILLIAIIVALLCINVFTLIRFNNLKKHNFTNDSNNPEKGKDEELDTYKTNFITNIQNSNLQLINLAIEDSLGKGILLATVFTRKQEQLLVCRFSQRYCESCINSSIHTLLTWIDSIGVENIIFLGNHRNNRIFSKTIPLYGLKGMKVYNSPEFNIPAEELGYPYFFILDSNLHISNVFVPNKGLPDLTNKYLLNINKRFFNNKKTSNAK